jgi:hypothetical protein
MHKYGGKPPKLKPEDKLYVGLKYLREYRAMDSIAAEYGACEGSICPAIQWAENTLAEGGTFALPGKRALKRKSAKIEYVAAGVTESYSGKVE